ncbi:MOSC domain-containing protein [Leeia sp.]|uniref:MOSC domain-containing protein n=1 Tax=Leeia sp. TaxID=2884678 RepID=UPI0035B0F0D3
MHLAALHHYPVKSCAGQPLSEADVSPLGLPFDRHWMLALPDGQFITGRDYPLLVRVTVVANAAGLQLSAPGMPPLQVSPADCTTPVQTGVWRYQFSAWGGCQVANTWFSEYLQTACQLLYIGAETQRWHDRMEAVPLSFADGYPLLLIGQGSLDDLNSRLAQPVGMANFRPNLVIAESNAYEEDYWQRIRIGEVEFFNPKPCSRCIFTTVDPATGEKAASGEPLATLSQYRMIEPHGVCFGINLVVSKPGTLRIGDPLEVLDWDF